MFFPQTIQPVNGHGMQFYAMGILRYPDNYTNYKIRFYSTTFWSS